MKCIMTERSSFFFRPILKGNVWNFTKELKTTGLIHSINDLAKMEMSTLVATWEGW